MVVQKQPVSFPVDSNFSGSDLRHVLLVSPNQQELNHLATAFGAYPFQLKAHCVNSVNEAIKKMKTGMFDIVVTHLRFNEGNGFKILSSLMEFGMAIPCIVINDDDIKLDTYAIQLGVITVLPKSYEIPQLMKLVINELESSAKGEIEGVSLAGMIQLLQNEKKTCMVKVVSRMGRGLIHVVHGQIHDACANKLIGFEATCEMLTWINSKIVIIHGGFRPDRVIQQSVTTILMEAARRIDDTCRSSGIRLPLSFPEPGTMKPGNPANSSDRLVALPRPNRGVQGIVSDKMRRELLHPIVSATAKAVQTMANSTITLSDICCKSDYKMLGDITGLVYLMGKTERMLAVTLPMATAREMTCRILAGQLDDPGEDIICDSIGELTNIIAGQIKGHLVGTPYEFSVSNLTVVTGEGHELRHLPDLPCYLMHFESEVGTFSIQLCVRSRSTGDSSAS